jgi:hypothetical protein
MRVRMLAGGAVLGLLVALVSPMAAFAQAETTTIHFSGTESSADVNRCTGVPSTLTRTFKGVTVMTELPNGTSHATTTMTATSTLVPDDPSQPSYTGKSTFRMGENVNSKTFNFTFTARINLLGSDGSRITDHVVVHVTINANGTATVEFENARLSCP